MSTPYIHTPATAADLNLVYGKAELVNGHLVRMPPTGGLPGEASLVVLLSLRAHAMSTGIGRAVPDNVAFLVNLPQRRSFSPDAAYWLGEPPSMKFYEGCPVFAVEVRSEGDYGPQAERDMAAKRADYFAAGALAVWDVDLLADDPVRCYDARAPLAPQRFCRGDLANASRALPGWTFNIAELPSPSALR